MEKCCDGLHTHKIVGVPWEGKAGRDLRKTLPIKHRTSKANLIEPKLVICIVTGMRKRSRVLHRQTQDYYLTDYRIYKCLDEQDEKIESLQWTVCRALLLITQTRARTHTHARAPISIIPYQAVLSSPWLLSCLLTQQNKVFICLLEAFVVFLFLVTFPQPLIKTEKFWAASPLGRNRAEQSVTELWKASLCRPEASSPWFPCFYEAARQFQAKPKFAPWTAMVLDKHN